MNKAAQIICKAFLQRFEPAKRAALLNRMSINEKKSIENLPLTYGDPSRDLESTEEQLNGIHYSWYSSFLRTLPENEMRLFISCLNEEQAKGLKKTLRLSNQLPELTPIARRFFEQRLFEAIKNDIVPLPISCLPYSELNILLEFDQEKMNVLIDHLGLHDLAIELRFIIETSKLKQIYSSLNEKEQRYLKALLHQKEAVSFKKMGLDKWDGNTEHLRQMIQQRGINRLAKALYGQDPSLIWYLCHRIDTEKAGLLQKFCAPLEHPKAVQVLAQQILELASQIQNLKTP